MLFVCDLPQYFALIYVDSCYLFRHESSFTFQPLMEGEARRGKEASKVTLIIIILFFILLLLRIRNKNAPTHKSLVCDVRFWAFFHCCIAHAHIRPFAMSFASLVKDSGLVQDLAFVTCRSLIARGVFGRIVGETI